MPGEIVYMVTEMMETRVTKEKPSVVYDLDDYRRGLRDRPNEAEIAITPHHKIDLWTIQGGQTVPLHLHPNSECVLVVLAGQGEYRMDGGSYDISRDMMAVAPPGKAHSIANTNPDPLVVLTVEGPGSFGTKVMGGGSGESFY